MAINNNVLLAAVLSLMSEGSEELKASIKQMAEESKKATETSDAAKLAGDSRTESKTGLLHTMRHVAATIAKNPAWNRAHFEAALLMAIQAGGNENSLKAYRSTLGTFIDGTKREANPLDAGMLEDEKVAYVALRDALKSDDAAERSNIRKAINEALGVLNLDADLADLRKVLVAVTAITDPVKARKEADKAAKGAGDTTKLSEAGQARRDQDNAAALAAKQERPEPIAPVMDAEVAQPEQRQARG